MAFGKIEWTEKTWNPITGCTKVSAGCKNCYAETLSNRLHAMGVKGYKNKFSLTIHNDRLDMPKKIKKPTLFFVNSMSDMFHPKIPFEFIDKVIKVIKETPQHNYQILTKRHKIMAQYFGQRDVPSNAWLGVSVENVRHGVPRIDVLRTIKNVPVRFLSVEPLLEDIGEIDLTDIHWVIVGGESGAKARIIQESWVENIKAQCEESNTAFFFKQWGGMGKRWHKKKQKSKWTII